MRGERRGRQFRKGRVEGRGVKGWKKGRRSRRQSRSGAGVRRECRRGGGGGGGGKRSGIADVMLLEIVGAYLPLPSHYSLSKK